jgi:hypothetical protein
LVCMFALSRSLAFPTQLRYILFSFCLPESLLKNETWRIADCDPHQRFSGCNDCHCYFTIHGDQWISAQTNFSVVFSDLLFSSPFGVVVQDFSFNFKILFVFWSPSTAPFKNCHSLFHIWYCSIQGWSTLSPSYPYWNQFS